MTDREKLLSELAYPLFFLWAAACAIVFVLCYWSLKKQEVDNP